MSNPSKAKGTHGENEVVALLHSVGLEDAHRTEAGKESWDIRGVGDWVIEVKYRKRWDLFKWIRVIRHVADNEPPKTKPIGAFGTTEQISTSPWAIFAIHGDRRTIDGAEVGAVMIVDADFGAELMKHWIEWK